MSFFRKKQTKFSVQKGKSGNCCLCKKKLEGRILGDPWNNWSHSEHRILFCSCCDRIISPHSSANGYTYQDGRSICGICTKQAVLNSVQANQAKRRVLELLDRKGFKGIPKNISIEMSQLNRKSSTSPLSFEAGKTFTQMHFQNHQRVGMTHQIKILFGVPTLEYEAILAHELLHVWQHEQGIRFSPLYCEGLCEIGAFLIYSSDKSAFATFKLNKMMKNPDPIYGNGFRLMLEKLQRLGWSAFIQEILKNKHGYEASVLKKIFGKVFG